MRHNINPAEKSSIFRYTKTTPLPDEPCFVDLRLVDGSELKGCRIETSFLVIKEIDIYYKTALIQESEVVMWKYS